MAAFPVKYPLTLIVGALAVALCVLAERVYWNGKILWFVVPQFMPEEPAERAVRQRVLDGSDIPVVRVELDGHWRIPGDGHPDARAAHAIAVAIATRLRTSSDLPGESP